MRLFVAAELPDAVVRALARWAPRDDGLRAVAPASLHLTLAFLGERSPEQAEAAVGVVRAVAAPVAGLTLGAGRWLPRRRPRVLAVEVVDSSGALGALQAAVVAGLGEAVGFAPERRTFLPHVTVARVRRGGRADAAVGPAPEVAPFSVTALTLMRSHLSSSPRGPARYEALERVAL